MITTLLIGSIFWFFVINLFDKLNKQTLGWSLATAMLTGIMAYQPAAWLNSLFLNTFEMNINAVDIPKIMVIAYSAWVGVNEEFIKFFVTYVFLTNCVRYKTPKQGYIYAACAGLGFALVENFFYLQWLNEQTLFMRLCTSTPLHISLALIWASGINKTYFFSGSIIKNSKFFVIGAALIHAFYNYVAISSDSITESAIKTFCVSFVACLIAFYLINKQPTKPAYTD